MLVANGILVLTWGRRLGLLVLLLCLAVDTAAAEAPSSTERDIKAGYLYNFLLFTDWPETATSSAEIKLCLLGGDKFYSAFSSVVGTDIKGMSLVIEEYAEDVQAENLHGCHALFIPRDLAHKAKPLIAGLSDRPVLTVSEVSGFIQQGGMVNFVRVGNNIRFEINKASAGKENIIFRSQMLRIATQVIGGND